MFNIQLTLNDGNKIPALGLGTWNSKNNLVGNAVRFAIESGYKHIDCASVYGNEKEIGESLKNLFSNGIKRDSVFITSKLWNTDHKAENVIKACKRTLSDLQVDYLDLYLVHWAMSFMHGTDLEPLDKDGYVITEKVPMQETWGAMEELVRQGLVRSIGISNFSTQSILDLLSYCEIKPAVNQIELHPYNSQTDLIEYMKHEGILATAYSPLGTPEALNANDPILLDDKKISEIASKYKKTPAQILLNWSISRGTVVIPKSTNEQRILENLGSLDFELEKEDIEEITKLNRNHRFVNPIGWYKVPYFA